MITEAKTDETKNRRIETAIEWMTEGNHVIGIYEK